MLVVAAAVGCAPPAEQAAAAVVMDERTGVIVYAEAPDRHLPMASCTKIMTALIVLERIPDRTHFVTVPAATVGRAGHWADSERLGVVNLLAAGLAGALPSPLP